LEGLLRPLAAGAVAAAERRIISAGGAVTEVLYALGREAEIVGVDSTSQHPAEALRTKANVGYLRALGAEGVLSLKPNLVIATDGAGPPDVLRIIESAGVTLVRVPDEPTPDGVLRRIAVVAQAVEADATALAGSVAAGFERLAADRDRVTTRKRVLFILSLQNGRALVGGRGTTADGMIALAGADNAAALAGVEGWKPLSDEGVVRAAPEVVLMMERSGPASAADPFALPAFASTPAGRSRTLVAMNGLYLLGFGPRTPQAARDLLAALYPESGVAGGTGR
jgi:iron complex transport system substrate-binding protein